MLDLAQNSRFELLDCIGRGGIAEVYRAYQVGLRNFRRRVALKVLRAEFAGDERHRERLVHEAKLGASLHHSNIVQTHDLVSVDERLAVVLELIDGVDLYEFLAHLSRRERPMPVSIAIYIAIEVLRGLGYAADLYGPALVHGDISPGNVMLGWDGAVRIIDFGVATTSPEASLRGKPSYLSPEIIAGESPDHRSDLFAVATILWESITLRRLFASEEEDKTLDNVLNVRIETRFARSNLVPPTLLDLLRRALSRDPAARFQTAQIFAAALGVWARLNNEVCTRDQLIEFIIAHGPKRPAPPEPTIPNIPENAVAIDLSGLEDVLAALDDDEATSSFTSLAEGQLDDRLAKLAETSGRPNERAFIPLGTLDPVTLPAIVSKIAQTRQTGALTIVEGERRKVLFFEAGALVHVASNIEAELLGNRLAQAGTIAEHMPAQALAHARARGIRLGQALIELKATTPTDLSRALEQQLAERFIDVLSWTDGRVTFERNRRPDVVEPSGRFHLDPLTLLLRGLRDSWSVEHIEDLLAPLSTQRLRWVVSPEKASRKLFLSGSEDSRLAAMSEGSLVESYIHENTQTRFLLAALLALGFLRVSRTP